MSGPAQNFAQNDADQAKVVAQIQKLLQDLSKCAPHPDRPEDNGPLFLNKSADLQMADEHDSMLGMALAESFLGASVASMAGEAAGSALSSLWNAAESASSIYQDRQRSSFSIGQRRMIASNFNGNAGRGPEYEAMMQSYLCDLPQRLSIEKHLSHELRRLYALRKNAPPPMPAMAA